MPRGTVKWFNEQRGFGFIKPDDGGQDVYVHRSAILMEGRQKLSDGEKVEYEVVQGPKGPQAAKVRPV